MIKAARKVDAGIVDIETNELWEKVKMHGVNFDRYLGKKTGGGLEKLRSELQAENEGVVLPLAISWIGGPKDVQKKKSEGKKASSVVFAVKGSKMAEKVLKGGLRAAGVKYDVERFMTAGPDSFCGVCIVLATVPGLEPDRMAQSGLLPGKQGYPAGSGTGSNRTAVPFYGSYNFASNEVFEF